MEYKIHSVTALAARRENADPTLLDITAMLVDVVVETDRGRFSGHVELVRSPDATGRGTYRRPPYQWLHGSLAAFVSHASESQADEIRDQIEAEAGRVAAEAWHGKVPS